MKRLAAFLALPGSDRLLLVRAAATLVAVRCALHLVSIKRLRAWAGHLREGNRPAAPIIWSVRAAARRVPGATCLSSALALQRLLSSAGHPSQIHIGVIRDASGFMAHAWLVHDGVVVIGEEEHERYTHLTAWDARKTLGTSG
ncbi:MAG: lasso peptide biosynthesis B2 protein [Reyranella sp.]|uniref:lasso peptide biosynthesis B2 protein n=1 Tax=Reyranella sp. TaxID=1929291 RepID=UPI00122BDEBD|nr:lasso peptide biosynthesis B2 protein [Reyranella sp.]TAJ88711.1 MAG: lasso peptide biosynthesis B2 protein [Reyranella sp.]TBR24364.1 MAG: lasso peptide biosynthesis B2 protein [Reyranella sp.]